MGCCGAKEGPPAQQKVPPVGTGRASPDASKKDDDTQKDRTNAPAAVPSKPAPVSKPNPAIDSPIPELGFLKVERKPLEDPSRCDVVADGLIPEFSNPGMKVSLTARDLERVQEPRYTTETPLPMGKDDISSDEMRAAKTLEIDPTKEKHLMYIAQSYAHAGPPSWWKQVSTEESQKAYLRWGDIYAEHQHPLVPHYKMLLWEARNGNTPTEMVGSPKGGYSKPTPLVYAEGVRWKLSDGTAIDPRFPDFNSDFQRLWEMEAVHPQQLIDREIEMKKVLKRFEEAARDGAATFIVKYSHGDRDIVWRCGNLLLSFQNSTKDMKKFGSRETAVKMNAHEIQGLRCVMAAGIRQLHTPLYASVNFLGNRVLVVAMVPLTNKTLILGPSNPTEHPDERTYRTGADIQSNMDVVARDLRLIPHSIATGEEVTVGSCLLEGHELDGRYYITQAASLLPCIPLYMVDGHKYRAELVEKFRQEHGKDLYFKKDENEIQEAIQSFLDKLLDEFTAELLSRAKEGEITGGSDLTTVMHEQGINVRCLGTILDKIKDEPDEQTAFQAQIIRVEIMARALKRRLRETKDERLLGSFRNDPHATLKDTVLANFNCDISDVVVEQQHIIERYCEMTGSIIEVEEHADGRSSMQLAIRVTEQTTKNNGSIFTWSRIFQKARPELLSALDRDNVSAHVSADGLTELALGGDLKENMKNISALFSERVVGKALPNIASYLLRRPTETCKELVDILHHHGVNLRYLGLLQRYLYSWQSGAGTARTKEGRAMAIEMLQAEMLARTFKSFLEDRLQGKTYTEAVKVGRKAFQELIDDPTFLVPRMYRKYGCQLHFYLPASNLVIGRCVELTGAVLLMKDANSVAEVAFRPRIRSTEIPKHLSVSWLKFDDGYSLDELINTEEQLLDLLVGRANTPLALPILSMLSYLYSKWVEKDRDKGSDWHNALDKMLEAANASTSEYGYANLAMGEFFIAGDDKRAAAEYLDQAVAIFKRMQVFTGWVQALRSLADTAQGQEEAIEYFDKAREVAKQAPDAAERSVLLGDINYHHAELLKTAGQYKDATPLYKTAIENYTSSGDLDKLEEKIALCKDSLGRCQYYEHEPHEALANLRQGLEHYKKVDPQHPSLPDLRTSIAKIEGETGKKR